MAEYHTVEPGECFLSIAARFGFVRWQTLYEHPGNAGFQLRGRSPYVLAPGDRVLIPPKREKLVSRPTAQTHEFRVGAAPCLLRLVLRDDAGKPLSGKRYRIVVGGSAEEGVTPDTGLIERKVPVYEKHGELHVWLKDGPSGADPDYCFDLAIGHLDPVEESSGVQARLANLGFLAQAGEAAAEAGDALAAAVHAFQSACGLPPTGKVDGDTRKALLARHEDV